MRIQMTRFLRNVNLLTIFVTLAVSSVNAASAVLFQEDFEDTDFASRGWYDSPGGTLSSTEATPGSTKSFECRFASGGQVCAGGTPSRHLFTATDSIYVSYYVKYSANWEGSNTYYHPHEFFIMTNEDSAFWGPSTSHLTAYIEQNEGKPLLLLQDALNIDNAQPNVDLTGITENRGIAGCNGGGGTCWYDGSIWRNEKVWPASMVYFQDTAGAYYKNDWHHVEGYFKLNTVSAGVGVADGVMKYWYDGVLIISDSSVIMRTGQYPNMMFNQFLMSPYIGDGSPVDQTMWVDDLVVSTTAPAPSPPTNLRTD